MSPIEIKFGEGWSDKMSIWKEGKTDQHIEDGLDDKTFIINPGENASFKRRREFVSVTVGCNNSDDGGTIKVKNGTHVLRNITSRGWIDENWHTPSIDVNLNRGEVFEMIHERPIEERPITATFRHVSFTQMPSEHMPSPAKSSQITQRRLFPFRRRQR